MTVEKALERVRQEISSLERKIEARIPPLWSEFAVAMWKEELEFYKLIEARLAGTGGLSAEDERALKLLNDISMTVYVYSELGIPKAYEETLAYLRRRLSEKPAPPVVSEEVAKNLRSWATAHRVGLVNLLAQSDCLWAESDLEMYNAVLAILDAYEKEHHE